MLNKNLNEFMENVEILSKEYAVYNDNEKGISFPFNTVNLLCRVDYLELTKEEYDKSKFEKKIEDLDYSIVDINRPQSKFFITKKEEDKYTIVDSKVSVRQVWNVTNAIGIFKSFTNKEEALETQKAINEEIFKYLQVK